MAEKSNEEAEAEVERLRARLAKVGAACDQLGDQVRRLFHDENNPREAGRVMGALHLIRAALADAPTEQTGGGE